MEFEVTHIGNQGKAIGPCKDGHPRTKLSVEDPGIQDTVLKYLLTKGTTVRKSTGDEAHLPSLGSSGSWGPYIAHAEVPPEVSMKFIN